MGKEAKRRARVKALRESGRAFKPQEIPEWKIRMQAKPSGTTQPLPVKMQTIQQAMAKPFNKQSRKKKRKKRKPVVREPIYKNDSPYLDMLAQAIDFKNYRAYINSKQWGLTKAKFKSLWPLACCVACQKPQYQLHHTTYIRMGQELMSDLIPLCQWCHTKIHECHRENRIPLSNYREALCAMMGWTDTHFNHHLADYFTRVF